MARVYFLYRSKKEVAPLKVRLQEKDLNGNFFQFEAKTQIHTSEELWNNTRKKLRGLTGNEKNDLKALNQSIEPLEVFILNRYEKDHPKPQEKDWLKLILKEYYTPKQKKRAYPTYLVDFIEYYLEDKKSLNELKESQRKRINTTKNKIIDRDFKADFIKYSEKKQYSINTQSKGFERIKTICKYAQRKGLEVSNSLYEKSFKINTEKAPNIYLNNMEIEKIMSVKLLEDYLDNARDWLLISIYSGQRISDFMRFSSNMIIEDENNRSFIKFEQVKTKHEMYLPLRTEINGILKKRNGEFPRAISDQKYNDYIKIVCKKAGIKTLCKGKKRVCIAPENKKPTKHDYRDVLGEFEKWELVSSHIGRRTFATINYGNIATPDLMYFTGHSTERQFLNYIVRPDYDKAKRAFDSFNNKTKKQKEIPHLSVVKNASNQ